MPSGFGFFETFDLFYKMHEVLNLDFDERIGHVMLFIKNFIYKDTRGKNPTPKMKATFNRLI